MAENEIDKRVTEKYSHRLRSADAQAGQVGYILILNSFLQHCSIGAGSTLIHIVYVPKQELHRAPDKWSQQKTQRESGTVARQQSEVSAETAPLVG